MGKILKKVDERLIDPHPDRNANIIRIYRKENGEAVIHFRNLKIMLLPHEVAEWSGGFAVALNALRAKGYMKNDL